MVLNQNQVSSKHLKMRLARRYTSQVFLYLRHIHVKVRLLTESRMTARLSKSRRLDWRKESLLMMEYAGLEFTRKMVLCLFQSLTASLSDSISCLIEAISSLRSFDSLRPSTAKLQNTPQLWSASLTCVGRLWRSRHNTIDAILIQWHVNELRGILKLLPFHLTSLAFSINFSLGSLVSLNCIGSVYINPGSHIRCYWLSSLCVKVVSTCFHLSAVVAISV